MNLQEQFNKPDHPFWQKIGNFCVIFLAPVGAVAIEVFVPEPYRRIAQVSWASLMALIKTGTKFTAK